MTTTSGPKRDELLTATLDSMPSIERAQLTRIELAAGQATEAHHHPCDVVGIVLSGRICFRIDGHDEILLQAGDPFFEPRNAYVRQFDNAAEDQPATFLACYLLSAGTTEVIKFAAPSAQ